MPKYKLKKEHFLQDKQAKVEPQLHEKGEVVDWAGTPSLHMEAIDKPAKERMEARVAAFAETKKKAAEKRTALGWSPNYERNMTSIITRPEPDPDASAQSLSGNAARTGKRNAA